PRSGAGVSARSPAAADRRGSARRARGRGCPCARACSCLPFRLHAVCVAHDLDGMARRATERLLDVEPGPEAIRCDLRRLNVADGADELLGVFLRKRIELLLYPPGPIEGRAFLDQLHLGARDQRKQIARPKPDVLRPQMAGRVIRDFALRVWEREVELL